MVGLVWLLWAASFTLLIGGCILIAETVDAWKEKKRTEREAEELRKVEGVLRLRDKIIFERLQREIGGGENV